MSSKLRLDFKLQAFTNPHVLEFNFDAESELPKRIAVVIGKNGVGKSQTLAHISKYLISGDRRLRGSEGERPLVNRLLAVSSPGETRNTFPGPRKRAKIDYRRIFLTRHPSSDVQSSLGDALVRLVRSEETIKGKFRWRLFCDAASQIAPLNELVVKLRIENGSEENIPLSEMLAGGEQQRLDRWGRIDSRADVFRTVNGDEFPLSSGQQTFIRFAAQACLHIENGTIVLVDEPETHLHPNYITEFVRLLDGLLEETGSLAILATHSAYLVRELPRSQIVVLRKSGQSNIEIAPVRLKTLGADVGAISAFIFEQEPFGFLIERLGRKLKARGETGIELLKTLEHELPAEAVMHLRNSLKAGKAK